MKPQLISLTLLASLALAASEASVFEIRRIEPRPSGKTKVFTINNAGRVETLNLNNEPLLDRSALIGARATEETVAVTTGAKPEQKSVPAIKLTFTGDGLARFSDVTTTLVGKQVGVVIDGKLVATPAVRETMRRNSITLTGNFTKEEATALVTKINTGK